MGKCPDCGKELRIVEGNWGLSLVYCKYCGWEQEKTHKEKRKQQTKGKESKWN